MDAGGGGGSGLALAGVSLLLLLLSISPSLAPSSVFFLLLTQEAVPPLKGLALYISKGGSAPGAGALAYRGI